MNTEKMPMPDARYYRERVAYVKPDQYSRDAHGWVVGEPHMLPGTAALEKDRPQCVSVVWMDGMVTVELRSDLYEL